MKFFSQNRYVLDLLASVMFFTRIPVNWSYFSEKAPDLTRAAWAFPLIGYLVGVISGGLGDMLLLLGTIIFGIAKEAFFYIPGIDGSFYRVFLGAVLVAAALTNENIRKRIIGSI